MRDGVTEMGTVTFVGAGPGDPELLTLKGHACIAAADLVLYAGSLVPPATVACAKAGARVVDSSPLTLEACHALMREYAMAGQHVARVHTGDPSLYGTVREQAQLLEADGIAYAIIPGVTSACAAAAAAGLSFTVPEQTQSLIITRMQGRTPVPEREKLRTLAAHGTSMAIYLSAGNPQGLQDELSAALPPDTPVLCSHRVGWPDARQAWATVGTLASVITAHAMHRQTMFLVLPAHKASATRSKLYDPEFMHGWRGK
ncbi:MAG: precorrin-4 C(11)-methyltransferase [Desulfovibrionaceae bacterium]